MIHLSSSIIQYIKDTFGEEFLKEYKNFSVDKYPSYIRTNDNRIELQRLINNLQKQGIYLRKNDDIENTFQITEGENLAGKTVEHLLGKYYIQSLSSMIPALVLSPTKQDNVLDLCAAPGSKSTQIAQLMDYRGTLYSNEPNQNRIKALVHNLDKSNAVNMHVLRSKGELLSKVYNEYFDKILVDAPCSALGVIQKNQEVSNWWNINSVKKLSSLQLKLLISAIKMAKVGADIVYSTCTLTIEENEYVINKVIENYPVELVEFDINLPYICGYKRIGEFKFNSDIEKTKRIIPWQINSEGFFIAKLIKKSPTNSNVEGAKFKNEGRKYIEAENKLIKEFIMETAEYYGIDFNLFKKFKYIIKGTDIYFVNGDVSLSKIDNFVRIGIKFGIIDKNKKLKLHSNAAQLFGLHAKKNIIELRNYAEVKTYFNGGIINYDECFRGQKIIKYDELILGTAVAINYGLKSQFPRSMRTTALN